MADQKVYLDDNGEPAQAPKVYLDEQGNTIKADFQTQNAPFVDARTLIPGMVADAAIGAVKGAGRTAVNLGRLVHQIPGVDALFGPIPSDSGVESTLGLNPTNTAQKVGLGAEQIGEFFIPAGEAEKGAVAVASHVAPYFRNSPRFVQAASKIVPKAVAQGTAAAATASAQGADPTTAAVMGAATPVLGAAVSAGGEYIGSKAAPLVRAAIKPTVAAMRRVAGASATGIDAQANKLVRFIIDSGVTTAEKARSMIVQAEGELQRVLAGSNATTDAPQRATRYLKALENSAARQGLPAADVATIRNAAAEVLESGLGKDVITMVPTPHPTLVGPNGQPIMVLTPQTSRALRTDVMADEALDRARATSRWDTRKAWGEQKGAQLEASKAVERAERDAAKVAVPELRPILARQGQAMQAADTLDRMEFRAANRDAVSLPAHVMAAGEVASGRLPIMGFAANWLRNNQMKAGIWADRLAKAIEKNDVGSTVAILSRFGVSGVSQMTNPAFAKP